MNKIIVPELGEGITQAVVACWHVQPGDQVGVDEDLVELVTDKASFNVPAGIQGTVSEINFKEGQQVNIGDTLAIID